MNDMPKFTAEIKVNVTLTQEDIDDIMVGALEGGINYWCRRAEVVGDYLGEYASEQLARGGSLILYDIGSSDKWELTREKFLNGFKTWFENGGDLYGAVVAGKVDCCNIDAGRADSIIQYALFGEEVFA